MIESRAEKRIKEVLDYLLQYEQRSQGNPLIGTLLPFKAFHASFYYLGTMQFDPDGNIIPRNA